MKPRSGHPDTRRRGSRRIWILLALLILLALIALAWWRSWGTPQVPAPVADEPAPTPTLTATSRPAPTPTSEPEPATAGLCLDDVCRHVGELPDAPATRWEMIDASANLNWSTPTDACLADIAAFMRNEGIAMDLISFTLRDELTGTGTPVFFQFPPSADPLNAPSPDESTAMCTLDPGTARVARCEAAVTRIDEAMNPHARLTLILASMDALRRLHYEYVAEDLESYYLAVAEELARFEPVVREENGAWTTNCWDFFERDNP